MIAFNLTRTDFCFLWIRRDLNANFQGAGSTRCDILTNWNTDSFGCLGGTVDGGGGEVEWPHGHGQRDFFFSLSLVDIDCP